MGIIYQMNTELFIHNSVFLLGGVVNIILAIFVLHHRKKDLTTSNITFILMVLSVATFQISHVLGILAPSAELSRKIFMFNMANIPIAIFMTHWFLALTGKDKDSQRKIALWIIYITGGALLALYIIFPGTFLLNSVPKLYFPFYYEPGPLQIIMRVWFNLVGIYYFIELIETYTRANDPIQKNRYKYVLFSILYGFVLGSTAIFLVYGIPFDPIWSAFFGLYTIPLAYAMVRYELLDIRVLAKRAVVYAVVIATVGVCITGINLFSDYMSSIHSGFPHWIGYVITSIIIGGLGVFVFLKAREADLLKYEFITIITHKFRTPLTRIKWSADSVINEENKEKLSSETASALETIRSSDSELIELTNILTTLNDEDAAEHLYKMKNIELAEIIKKNISEIALDFKSKKIELTTNITSEATTIHADEEKIKFAFDILLNNARVYTPENGHVSIQLFQSDAKIICTITDDGIGIPKASQAHIFTKFYRSTNAQNASTEGTGIGLYMAKKIIERNGATIAIQSEGEGRGSMVTLTFRKV